MNNEFVFITHLSADKLSGLNCLSVIHLRFLSSNFAFSRPKNQKLKKIVMEPIQKLTNICYLDRVYTSYCRCVLFVKLSFSKLKFSRDVAAKKFVISFVKIVNEIKCFSSRLS